MPFCVGAENAARPHPLPPMRRRVAYLNMLHAFVRDDLSISVSISKPAPAAAASAALTLKVKVLTCQESAALWAPAAEYPACAEGGRKLKAKAWAMFLPRGALPTLNVTDGKGVQVRAWAGQGAAAVAGLHVLGVGRPPEAPPPAHAARRSRSGTTTP